MTYSLVPIIRHAPISRHYVGTPQGIEQVTLQLKDTPTKVYAIGAKLFY